MPFETLLPLFADGGYDGYISSEYEGWHWDTTSDPFETVVRQQELSRRILAEHAAAA